jgi:hypothetical protein
MANVADYNVANASGASVRSDLNNILQAVVTLNSGTSAPSTMYPFMIWIDTNTNLVKMRNGANDAWLTMPFAMNASNSVDINAGTIDGVSLGSGSAITSAVISGDLTVDTSTLKVDSTNNRVGIGTSSPSTKLHLNDGSADAAVQLAFQNDAREWRVGVHGGISDSFTFYDNTASATRMVVDSSGRVGIGIANPARDLVVSSSGQTDLSILAGTSASAQLQFGDSGDDNIGQIEYSNSINSMLFYANATERMRIDSAGGVLIARTSQFSPASKLVVAAGSDGGTTPAASFQANTSTSSGAIIVFYKGGGTEVGSIAMSNLNAGTSIAYNTSSDARLKDVTGEARGLEVINNLNPVAFNWKETGTADEGLIAQEVQEHMPNVVHEGNNGYLQMDYSKLATPLIKAVQEQQEQIEELKQQINELRGK